ncbi:hypothetical protein FACS1894217_01890 [Clostridia bacterium]|nr:hypothetical protein FACS1894217_01890 [Clostridia bacterium]
MSYRPIYTLKELQEYLSGATIVAFDFETAPDEKYRREDKAALDAHKSHIVGISFSMSEGSGVYLPIAHRLGENAADLPGIWEWLSGFFVSPAVTKIAHNLAFESAFLYASIAFIFGKPSPSTDAINATPCLSIKLPMVCSGFLIIFHQSP